MKREVLLLEHGVLLHLGYLLLGELYFFGDL